METNTLENMIPQIITAIKSKAGVCFEMKKQAEKSCENNWPDRYTYMAEAYLDVASMLTDLLAMIKKEDELYGQRKMDKRIDGNCS